MRKFLLIALIPLLIFLGGSYVFPLEDIFVKESLENTRNQENPKSADALWRHYSESYARVREVPPLKTLVIVDLKNFSEYKFHLEDYTGLIVLAQTKNGFLLRAGKGRERKDILQFNVVEKKIILLALASAHPEFPMFVDEAKEYFFYCVGRNDHHESPYHLFNLLTQQDATVSGEKSPGCGYGNFYSQKNNELFLSYCGGGHGGYSCDYGAVNTATKLFRVVESPAKRHEPSMSPLPAYIISYAQKRNFYVNDRGVYKNLANGTPYQVGNIYYSPELNGAVVLFARGANVTEGASVWHAYEELLFVSSEGEVRTIVKNTSRGTLYGKLIENYFVYNFN